MEQLHAVISGRVQGVWYRASTQQKAQSLELVGWVRNLSDGRVELLAQGPRESLEVLLAWCYTGPENALVSAIDFDYQRVTERADSFSVGATV
ncbi:MAG: acylphosphatase [Gammaproteobacteria bacterium]|nr:acylphosphatase [Gammaproteobacteria bacterium]